MPNCGTGWQAGAEQATGDYLHLTADDIEPLPGWWQAAILMVDRGFLPGAHVWRPDGSLESAVKWEQDGYPDDPCDLCRIPFCSMKQWEKIGPMIPVQYYSDNWFTDRAKVLLNMDTRLAPGYDFVHHRPRGQRPGEQNQMLKDQAEYLRYVARGYKP
jgi:hypothetical protein